MKRDFRGKILIKDRLLSILDDVKASNVLSRDLMTILEIVYAFGFHTICYYVFVLNCQFNTILTNLLVSSRFVIFPFDNMV